MYMSYFKIHLIELIDNRFAIDIPGDLVYWKVDRAYPKCGPAKRNSIYLDIDQKQALILCSNYLF